MSTHATQPHRVAQWAPVGEHADQATLLQAVVGALSAMHLQMSTGQAVMTLERRSFDANQQLQDLLEIQYRPDQLRYQMRLDYEANNPETSA